MSPVVNIHRSRPAPALGTWTDQLVALDPEIWLEFDEAAAPFADRGNDPLTNFTAAGGGAHFQLATAAVPEQAVCIDKPGFRGYRIRGQGISDGLTTPSGTGTLILVFRARGGGRPHLLFQDTNGGGLDDGLFIFLEHDRMRIRMDDSNTTFYEVTLAYSVANVKDDNWHMVVIQQPGDNTGYDVYVDGVDRTTSLVEVTATLSRDTWFDNTTLFANDIIALGEYEGSDFVPLDLLIDEMVYFDGTLLTSQEISDLASALDLTKNNGFLQELSDLLSAQNLDDDIFTLFTTNRSPGNNRLTQHSINNTSAVDNEFYDAAGSTTGGDAMTFRQTGWKNTADGVTSILFAGRQSTEGEHFRETILSQYTPATGFGVAIFKTSTLLANPYLFGVCDNSGGGFSGVQLIDSAAPQRIRLRFSANSSANQYQPTLDTDAIGIDLYDGNWHILIWNQPADNNGVEFWLDGTKYVETDTEYTANLTGSATNNWYFANVSSPDNTSFGALRLSSTTGELEGNLGFVGLFPHNLTDLQADALYDGFAADLAA